MDNFNSTPWNCGFFSKRVEFVHRWEISTVINLSCSEPESLGTMVLISQTSSSNIGGARGQSPVNIRESPSHPNSEKKSKILSHPLFDEDHLLRLFDPCAKVPMAWWSSCRCTRKAIHNLILGLIRMAMPRFTIWFNFLHSPPFLDGPGFSSQNMTLSEADRIWYYDTMIWRGRDDERSDDHSSFLIPNGELLEPTILSPSM